MREKEIDKFNNELSGLSQTTDCDTVLSGPPDWLIQENLLKLLIIEEKEDVNDFEQKIAADNQAIIDRSLQDGQRKAAKQIITGYPQWDTSFNA